MTLGAPFETGFGSGWLAAGGPWVASLLLVAAALVVAQWAWTLVGRVFRDRASAQAVMLVQRLVWWTVTGLAVSSALRTLGFDLSVLLGAAGIVTVAVGFASQTAASNLISGLFLVAERPFVVGDVIQLGLTVGEVVAVDLLSVKLRTFDNRLVRLPNEALLKTEIVNLTHFAIRRVDLEFVLPYDADPDRVRAVVVDAADDTPGVLDEPRPSACLAGFGDAGVRWVVSAWVPQKEHTDARDRLAQQVLVACTRAGWRFPAPRREVGGALTVRVADGPGRGPPTAG